MAGGTEAAIHPLPHGRLRRHDGALMTTRNDDGRDRAAPGPSTWAATASSSARAAPCWSSSPRSTPGPAARRSTPGRAAPASPPTATTSSSPTPRARRHARHQDGAPRGRRRPRHRRPRQRARDLHPGGRHRRGRHAARRPRRARRPLRGHRHQVDDRPPARRAPARWRRSPPSSRCATGSVPRRSTWTTWTPTSTSTSDVEAAPPEGDIVALNDSFGFGGHNVACLRAYRARV